MQGLSKGFPPWLLGHRIVGKRIMNQIIVFCWQGLRSILEWEIVENTLHLPLSRHI